jgi:hypothetical protein
MTMAERRDKSEWGRLSHLMCLFANCNIDTKKTKPFVPADFNPYVAAAAKVKRLEEQNEAARRLLFHATASHAHGQQT